MSNTEIIKLAQANLTEKRNTLRYNIDLNDIMTVAIKAAGRIDAHKLLRMTVESNLSQGNIIINAIQNDNMLFHEALVKAEI